MLKEASVERKLAAILAADIAGFSRLMSEDEEATLERLRSYMGLMGGLIEQHRGRVFSGAGDSVLAEFSSPVEALRCAMEIQGALGKRNADLAADQRMNFRIGINLGDVLVAGSDLHGDEVNIAARLESMADPGGICLSEEAYRQVRKRVHCGFEDLGERWFKNISEPIHVYRVIAEPATDGPALTVVRRSVGELSEKPSIVVLPFENLSGDPAQDYFCDGLTQDITTDLSKFANLFVIAANTAFSYKGRRVQAQVLHRELGVRYMVEGSVQRLGSRIRVNAQLIDARSGHHLWAERFDRSADDLFAMQDEIIQMTVAALAVKVDAAERDRAMHRRTDSVSAYETYLKGVHFFSWEKRDDLERSIELFAKATELDPNFARAWGWQAYALVRAILCGWHERAEMERAEAYAKRAVQLDPFDYSNHWDLAFVYLNAGRFGQAMSEYEKARRFNPNDADLLVEMAEAMISVGRTQEGIEQILRAMQINPQTPDWYRWVLAWGYFNARQYDEAEEQIGHMIAPQSDVSLLMAAVHAYRGETAKAEASVKFFLNSHHTFTIDDLKKRVSFRNVEDQEHWLEGLRIAGLKDPGGTDPGTGD